VFSTSLYRSLICAVVVAAIVGAPSAALAQRHTVTYAVAYNTRIRPQSTPFTGNMTLTFNNGAITGRYTDTSIRPGGPLARMRSEMVTGTESNGTVSFSIGSRFNVHGSIHDNVISGNALVHSTQFVFHARPST
jgi:hypothetical protein